MIVAMIRLRRTLFALLAVSLSAALLPTVVVAQRGGIQLTRLEILEQNFKMTGDQRKAVKSVFDEAHKSAAPVREGLAKTRADISGAIQAGKSAPDVDAAVVAYGAQATAMTSIEMRAVAQALEILDKDLQNPPGIQALFFLARGMFLGKGGWDNIPDGKGY